MSKTVIPKEVVPPHFKEMIVNELILPTYRENIQYTIRTRTCWSVVCTICLTGSTILIGVSSLLSFASSSFPEANMGFYAGSVGIVAVLLKEFSSYANSQDHLKTVEMNEILKNIGINFKFEDTSGLESQLIHQMDQHKHPAVATEPLPNSQPTAYPPKDMIINPMIPPNHITIQPFDLSGNIVSDVV